MSFTQGILHPCRFQTSPWFGRVTCIDHVDPPPGQLVNCSENWAVSLEMTVSSSFLKSCLKPYTASFTVWSSGALLISPELCFLPRVFHLSSFYENKTALKLTHHSLNSWGHRPTSNLVMHTKTLFPVSVPGQASFQYQTGFTAEYVNLC